MALRVLFDCPEPAELLENGVCLRPPWPPLVREAPDPSCFGDAVKPAAYRDRGAVDTLRRCLWARLDPPYLAEPRRAVRIGTKRQLFVDDFLIERASEAVLRRHGLNGSGSFERVWHTPRLESDEPVLPAAAGLDSAVAIAYPGGLIWSASRRRYLLWYQSRLHMQLSLASSADLRTWQLHGPVHNVSCAMRPDGNDLRRLRAAARLAGASEAEDACKLDDVQAVATADGHELFLFVTQWPARKRAGLLYRSTDGLTWAPHARTGPVEDRSSLWWNPWRQRWVFNLRLDWWGWTRTQRYFETADAHLSEASLAWRLPYVCKPNAPPHVWDRLCASAVRTPMMTLPTPWLFPDRADQHDYPNYDDLLLKLGDAPPPHQIRMAQRVTDIYAAEVVPYESVFVGMLGVWEGGQLDHLKHMRVHAAFSRDGFHFHRPRDARPLMGYHTARGTPRDAARSPSKSRRRRRRRAASAGNDEGGGGGSVVYRDVQPVANGVVVRGGDELLLLCSKRSKQQYGTFAYVLRRDGFASMDSRGDETAVLLTPPLLIERGVATSAAASTQPQLHLNVDASHSSHGQLRVGVLSSDGSDALARWQDCVPIVGNGTDVVVQWTSGERPKALHPLAAAMNGATRWRELPLVRLIFVAQGRVSLYAFWVQ